MLIDYENVTISHDDGETILRGVNFKVDRGEFVYITGKVGTGKSSLLKTVYGELAIDDADRASVLGRDVTKLKRNEIQALRREIGIIFQDFKLLAGRTVRYNLDFVLRATGWKTAAARERRIKEVLEAVGMPGVEERRPHELSGGEQQRIAIARALLNSPKVVLADEPTGNLDPMTAESIMGLFRDIASMGSAVIVTTHNLTMLDKFPGIEYQCGDGTMKFNSTSI